jgi:hypothetical protein
VGVLDHFKASRAGGGQRFQQRLEHASAGLEGGDAEIGGLDRFKGPGRSGFTLGVQDRVDKRGQLQQRLCGGLFGTLDNILDSGGDPGEYRRLGAGLFERREKLLETKIAPGDNAAGDGEAAHFGVDLVKDGDAHGFGPLCRLRWFLQRQSNNSVSRHDT